MIRSRVFYYQLVSTSFCIIVLLSNLLSAKMVPFPWLHIAIPAGLTIYPLTFFISDLVTELFGAKRARLMVALALGMNLLGLGIIQIGLWLPGQGGEEERVFQAVFGMGGLRIISSLFSYLIAQLVDIQLYAAVKRWSGPKWVWLRANVSTLASQAIDTILIDLLCLFWGLSMPLAQVAPIMLFSYLYKALFSVISTPLFYLAIKSLKREKEQFP